MFQDWFAPLAARGVQHFLFSTDWEGSPAPLYVVSMLQQGWSRRHALRLRRHARSFPWSVLAPPETPHIHPLYDRLLRLSAVESIPFVEWHADEPPARRLQQPLLQLRRAIRAVVAMGIVSQKV